MKRCISLLLVAAMFLCFVGCKQDQQEPKEPVSFYYPCVLNIDSLEADGSLFKAIDFEIREADGHRQDLEFLLSLYLLGPASAELKQVFPEGTQLESVQLFKDQLQITLSEHLGQLSGLQLTLACACLSLTCLELCDANTVSIQAAGTLLDGEPLIVMSRESLILSDQDSYTNEPTK